MPLYYKTPIIDPYSREDTRSLAAATLIGRFPPTITFNSWFLLRRAKLLSIEPSPRPSGFTQLGLDFAAALSPIKVLDLYPNDPLHEHFVKLAEASMGISLKPEDY